MAKYTQKATALCTPPPLHRSQVVVLLLLLQLLERPRQCTTRLFLDLLLNPSNIYPSKRVYNRQQFCFSTESAQWLKRRQTRVLLDETASTSLP